MNLLATLCGSSDTTISWVKKLRLRILNNLTGLLTPNYSCHRMCLAVSAKAEKLQVKESWRDGVYGLGEAVREGFLEVGAAGKTKLNSQKPGYSRPGPE